MKNNSVVADIVITSVSLNANAGLLFYLSCYWRGQSYP